MGRFAPKFWRIPETSYICIVFFIVLDLRLTKDWLSGIDSLFLLPYMKRPQLYTLLYQALCIIQHSSITARRLNQGKLSGKKIPQCGNTAVGITTYFLHLLSIFQITAKFIQRTL